MRSRYPHEDQLRHRTYLYLLTSFQCLLLQARLYADYGRIRAKEEPTSSGGGLSGSTGGLAGQPPPPPPSGGLGTGAGAPPRPPFPASAGPGLGMQSTVRIACHILKDVTNLSFGLGRAQLSPKHVIVQRRVQSQPAPLRPLLSRHLDVLAGFASLVNGG